MEWDVHLFNLFIRHAGDSDRIGVTTVLAMIVLGFSFYLFRKYRQLKTSQSFKAFLGSIFVLVAVTLGALGDFFIPFWFTHYRLYLIIRLVVWILAIGGGYMSCQDVIFTKGHGQSDDYVPELQSNYGIASAVVAALVFALMIKEVLFTKQGHLLPFFVFVLLPLIGCILGVMGLREKNRNKFFLVLGLGLNSAIVITIAALWFRTL